MKLPILRATLIRLFPGRAGAYTRMTIRRTAESFVETFPSVGGNGVYTEVRNKHASVLTLGQGKAILAALEEDLIQHGRSK